MSKPKKEYRQTVVTVAGQARFPLDMLRYDSCRPYDGDDASEIERSLTENGSFAGRRRSIRLARYSSEGTKATAARWASFGWVVTSDTGDDR